MSGPEGGVAASGGGLASSSTRAFLFADLRGYTRFADDRGAAAAAELLERYRRLVREAVGRHSGAEIRTEGDSFYVVFDSVSASIGCALAIVETAAAESADRPDAPIDVGIGIHAGETVEAGGDYVGSPVNVAARLCAIAGPGEALVSDTVRALTQAVVPVAFESRGRRTVKGIAEPIGVFAIAPVEGGGDAWQQGTRARRAHRTRRRRIAIGIGAVAGLAVVAVAAFLVLRPPPALPPGPWTIGVDLPLTGPNADSLGRPILDAIELAVDGANASGDLGIELRLDVRDHGGTNEFGLDGEQAIANMAALIADPRVIAVVGPSASGLAEDQIPLTNEAGLLQCGLGTTSPALTKPGFGALDLRSAAPDRINFVRTAPSDDIQGLAAAAFLYNDLGVRSLLAIDDTGEGRLSADSVSEAFEALGGTVTRRALNPGADAATVLEPLSSGGGQPTGVFFGGYAETGASAVRQAMVEGGIGSVPFVSWDWLGEPADAEGSFLHQTGADAVGSYISHASFAPPKAAFVDAYRASYGREPDEYASSAYACMEVILAALRGVARQGATEASLREAVRASVVDPSHRYETVLGSIGFDANGDSLQQFGSILRVDPDADDGKPAWVVEKQQDYGPSR